MIDAMDNVRKNGMAAGAASLAVLPLHYTGLKERED